MLQSCIKAIIYDFDGVLVDSVKIKQHAFFKLFQDEGEGAAQTAYDYHLADNRNRFQVVGFMADRLGKDKEYEKAKLSQFKDLVVNSIVSAREIPGSADFIKGSHFLNMRQFVVSGTPHGELREILGQKKWLKYFTETFGTPIKKVEHNAYIMRQYALKPSEVLFIGDMESDYRAASFSGFKFLARSDDGTFPVDNLPIIKDFTDLNTESVLRMVRDHENS